jgi:predicted phosphatase
MKYQGELDIKSNFHRIVGKPDPFKNSIYQNAVRQCRTKVIKFSKKVLTNIRQFVNIVPN